MCFSNAKNSRNFESYENFFDSYEGDFKNGLANGRGKTVIHVKHEGKLSALKALKNKGSMGSGKHQYDGDWVDNKMHGKGTFYFANGDVYKGEVRRFAWCDDHFQDFLFFS